MRRALSCSAMEGALGAGGEMEGSSTPNCLEKAPRGGSAAWEALGGDRRWGRDESAAEEVEVEAEGGLGVTRVACCGL